MTYVVAALVLCAAMALLKVLNVVSRVQDVMTISRTSIGALSNKALDDDEKERIARSSSVKLFGHFIWISAVIVVAFGAPLVAVWLFDLSGTPLLGPVLDTLASWPFIIAAVVLGAAVILIGRRNRGEF